MPALPSVTCRPRGSSFSSIRDTIAHIAASEWVWLRRWRVREALVNTQESNERAVAQFCSIHFLQAGRPGQTLIAGMGQLHLDIYIERIRREYGFRALPPAWARHALVSSGPCLAFGSTTGNLYLSEDAGDSWTAVANNLPPIYSVRFA